MALLLIAPLLAFLTCSIGHVVALKVFPGLGLLDSPDRYGLKRPPLPYPAGIIPVVVFLFFYALIEAHTIQFFGLLTGITLLAVVSFIDDRISLPWHIRLTVQIVIAIIIFATGSRIYTVTNPIGGILKLDTVDVVTPFLGSLPLWSGIFTIFWLGLTMNALNWFDGIPGQVSALSTIGFLVIGFLALSSRVNQSELAMFSFILAGIAAACLAFDFPPPRMLIGDTGAMFFGLMLGVLTIYAGGKVATGFLVLGIPLIDSFFVIIQRIVRGKSPFMGSRSGEHLHHRLLEKNWSGLQVIFLTVTLGGIFGILALFLSTLQKFIAAMALTCVLLGLKAVLSQKKKEVYHRRPSMETFSTDTTPENVMLVDGYRIRNTIDTDFNIIHRHGSELHSFSPKFYIPRDEVWIDHPYADERNYLLVADRVVDHIRAGSREELLKELKRTGFLQSGPPPPFVLHRESRGPLTVCTVNGAIVRRCIDPEFVLGGHDLVYPFYIPENEVWIDGKMDPRDLSIVLEHELEERMRMERDALPYEIAHEYATTMERVLRRKAGGAFPGEWDYPFYGLTSQEIVNRLYIAAQPRKKRPVTVEHVGQSVGMCGPASLKIACSAFGKNFTEEELAGPAGSSVENGTEHEGLVRAVQTIGGTVVVEKEKGTFGEIAHLVNDRHVPVIVGWFDGDDDHYSVVTEVTPEYLILADPSHDRPERFIRREHFEKVWFDFVGADNRITSWRWYMAIQFDS